MAGSSLFPDPIVRLVAGVDEAGRGPLAGPVAVAAVILDESRPIAGLNDSKQLSEAKREALFPRTGGRRCPAADLPAPAWTTAAGCVGECRCCGSGAGFPISCRNDVSRDRQP